MSDTGLYVMCTLVTNVVLLILYVGFKSYRYRLTRNKLVKTMKKRYPGKDIEVELCRGQDGMWRRERRENLLSINAYITIGKGCTYEKFVAGWKEIMDASPEKYKRFTQRMVDVRGYLFWTTDMDFDLKNHIVREYEGPKNYKELQKYMSQKVSEPLPVHICPWKMYYLDGYEDIDDPGKQDKGLVVIRISHCISDGVGLATAMFDLFGNTDSDQPNVQKMKPNMFQEIFAYVAGLYLITKTILFQRADNNIMHGPESYVLGEKRMANSANIPMSDVKTLKNKLKCSVNDLMMGMLGKAFQRYMSREMKKNASISIPLPKSIHCIVPINMRHSDEIKVQNDIVCCLIDLPTTDSDTIGIIKKFGKKMDRIKNSIDILAWYNYFNLLVNLCPTSFQTMFIDNFCDKATCVVTNVPGPRGDHITLKHSGAKIVRIVFWVPMNAGVGVGISLLSLNNNFNIGILSDISCIQDPDLLVECFKEVLDELKRELKV